MAQRTRSKLEQITSPPPVFIGVSLFFGADTEKLLIAVKSTGDALVQFANGVKKSRFKTPSGYAYTDQSDRKMLTRWLTKLPKLPPPILKEIANYAKQVVPQSTKIDSYVEKGEIVLYSTTYCSPTDAKVAWGYIVAGLLASGYGENIVKCPECGKWFFDLAIGRPIKKFCTQSHSNRFRQRKFREKNK